MRILTAFSAAAFLGLMSLVAAAPEASAAGCADELCLWSGANFSGTGYRLVGHQKNYCAESPGPVRSVVSNLNVTVTLSAGGCGGGGGPHADVAPHSSVADLGFDARSVTYCLDC
ncbi:peptidase inhibitor family I36 protein [Nocardia sp. NPDC003482]